MKKKSSYMPIEVNKWNRKQWSYPAFMPNEYNEDEKLYWFGGKIAEGFKDGFGNVSFGGWKGLGEALGQGASRLLGVQPDLDYEPYEKKDNYTPNNEEYAVETAAFGGPIKTRKVNHFSDGGPTNAAGGGGGGLLGGLAGSMGSIGSAIGGAIGGAISNGYTSGVGNVMNSVGKIASVIPGPWGAAISGGLQILGGGVNALFGTKVDQAKLNAANKGTNALKSFKSGATSFDKIGGITAQANVQDAYSGGVFRKGWAEERNRELKRQRAEAKSFAYRSISNNVSNLAKDQISNAMANYSAFGGPIKYKDDVDNMNKNKFDIGGSMDVLFYDLLRDKQDIERQKAKFNNKAFPTSLAGMPNGFFSFGGNMGTNSSDFATGLTHIDAGSSHEQNPNDGVQVGVDPEGTPNLVEEGETIWNDYVFSARIKADAETKKKFHLPLKKDITYAEISKKLEKEIAERVNDPISEAGFKAQMQTLQEQQERQKQEMEAKRAKEAFEALSPEEQAAIMQRAAQEEQMAQQAAQEQAAAEQQPQATPEELAMAEQAQQQADGSQAMVGQEPQINAEGGHLFNDGGSKLKKGLYKALGFFTDSDFLKWAREHKLSGDDKWEESGDMFAALANDDEAWRSLMKDPSFIEAIKDDKALADAISMGYDFGDKSASSNDTVFTDPNKGNWDEQMFEGWKGSKDDAWIELVKNVGEDKLKGMTREELEKAFKNTTAYKNTTKWLQNSPENMRKYLKSVLDTSTSKSAIKHALQFVNEDGTWKDTNKVPTYAQVFGENGKGVRETYPGTYWHSVREANVGNRNRNFVWNPEGERWDAVVGDVGKDWTLDSSYDWYNDTDNVNDKVNYYYRSEGTDDFVPVTEEEAKKEERKKVVPNLKNEKLRYAGLFGPAVGLGMQALGIGKPDYSGLDAAVNSANGPIERADYKPIGNYLTYRPMDIWYQQNALNAQARATDRALMNSNSPSRAAGLLASGYNSQLASGNLYRQALEYNDAQRKQVEDFNRATNMFNADAYNKLSMFNAGEQNRARQYGAQMAMHAANTKLDSDAGWYNGIYGNVAGLFKGISDLGKENAEHNMIAKMWADGLAGTATPDTNSASDFLEWAREGKKKVKTAKGGAIKRKKGKRRGLTI